MVRSSAVSCANVLCEFKNQFKAAKGARRIGTAFREDAVSTEFIILVS